MPSFNRRQQRFLHNLNRSAVAAGAAVAITGAFFFIAWLTGAMTWRGFQTITIKTNAALSLLCCGFSL